MDFPKKRSNTQLQTQGNDNSHTNNNSNNNLQTTRRRRTRQPSVSPLYGRILTCSFFLFSCSLLVLYHISSMLVPSTRQLQKPPVATPSQPIRRQRQRVILSHATGPKQHAHPGPRRVNNTFIQTELNHLRSHAIAMPFQTRPITNNASHVPVPFVIMAYNRLNYLRQTVISLLQSDFPRHQIPLIVSVDGHVAEMLDYLEALKSEFPLLTVWIHPFACFDHPNDFPIKVSSPDLKDTYGNPRSPEITCCKHHFTWMLREAFTTQQFFEFDTFLFLEEDYIVAPSIYDTIQQGIRAMKEFSTEAEFFGICLDPTNGGVSQEPVDLPDGVFYAHAFRSGPMTLHRSIYQKLVQSAHEYCTIDESNWDWALVQLTLLLKLPHTVLFPSRSQVRHIGLQDGMHEHVPVEFVATPLAKFHATAVCGPVKVIHSVVPKQVSGGWGHFMDHEHCLNLLRGEDNNNNNTNNKATTQIE